MSNCVILNPAAGSATEIEELKSLLAEIEELTCLETTKAGDAARLARQAVENNATLVIAAGGDGTLSELVNGLSPSLGKCKAGVYPLGTGNDFARSVYTSLRDEDIVRALKNGNTRAIDLLKITSPVERLGINAIAGGFGALLSANLHATLKQWLGSVAYAVTAINTLRELDVYTITVAFDDEDPVEIKALNIVLSNGQWIGGGVPIAPKARLDDGLLDVVIFPDLPPEDLLGLVPVVLSQEHTKDERLITRRARRVVVESTPPMPCNIDGEIVGEGRLEVEVLPGALQFLVDPIRLDLEIKGT